MTFWWPVPPHVDRRLGEIQESQARTERMLEHIMSQDDTVAAVAADIEARVTDLTNVMGSVKGTVDQLLAEVASGTSSVSPATLSRLQSDQATLDAAISAAQQQASDEATAANPAPPAPPAS